MRSAALALTLALLLPLVPAPAAAPGADLAPGLFAFGLQQVASGVGGAVAAVHGGDASGRLFIVQQSGIVRVLLNDVLQPGQYLNVASKVRCCGEQGLLGLAFAPDFETSGRLYISYTRTGDGASVLERLVTADPANTPPPPNGEILLVIAQPFSNHNGGNIAFGPDGYLYYGLGDGGSGGDPLNHGQNLNSLLGKMLRLDVSGATGYAIPPTNPFATGGGRAEIWAYGLRNPWRWSFDRVSGDLWIADVGQNQWEEVNRQSRASLGGENYGWRWWEGNHVYASGGPVDGMTFPVAEYQHSEGCSVTGGYVYRGAAAPSLQGLYLYGDYCSGRIWGAYGMGFPPGFPPRLPVPLPGLSPQVPLPLRQMLQSGGVYQTVELADTSFNISSFGEDEAGEVYVVSLGGSVHRIVAA